MASVFIFFLLVFPVLVLLVKNPENHFRGIAFCRRIIARLSSLTAGFFYRIKFETSIDWSKPYIICANHTSNLDITTMMRLCPADFVFMGKIELMDNPVTGMFFRTIDIPLNRKSNISAFRAFKKAEAQLRNGRSVIIFPEGQIGDDYPPRLHDFKNGPFKLAIETQVAILPVVIHDAWKLLCDDGKRFGSRPGIVTIDVLNPIKTKHLQAEDAEKLRDEVYGLIKKHWQITGGL